MHTLTHSSARIQSVCTLGHYINANEGFEYIHFNISVKCTCAYSETFYMDILYVPCMCIRNTFRKTLNMNINGYDQI